MANFNIKPPLNAPSTSAASDIFGFVFPSVYGPPANQPVTIPNPHFPQGSLVQVGASFYSRVLAATDPTLVALQVRAPSGAISTWQYGVGPQILRDGIGVYHAFIDTTPAAGTYIWRWGSRGNGTISMLDTTFVVDASTLS